MSAAVSIIAPPAQPFLKWPGGKRSLLPRILAHVPLGFETYHEPFVGGGALFFAIRAEWPKVQARINDANARLVRTYAALKANPEAVIRKLRPMRNEETFFYRTRAKRTKIDGQTDATLAAWMIYLNKTGYNGLYRENRKGEVNIPFGHRANATILDAANLRAVSAALSGVAISSGDFEKAARRAEPGDFVYFDPPYMPRTEKEFVAYRAGGFSRADQERLAKLARELKEQGVSVLLSNSDTEEVRDLYAGFSFEEVQGRRSISRDGLGRASAPDLLIW